MSKPIAPTVVALEGPRLSLAEQINEVRDGLFDHVEQGRANLILDFTGVEFVDSSFLGMLIIALRRSIQKNGDIRLCCLQPPVASLFHMMRLDKIYAIHETVDEARESFQ